MRAAFLGALLALAAALLFGLVSATAKGSSLAPLVQGGIAYLFAGLALGATLRSARFRRADVPLLLAMALVGGTLAPALLFYGLRRTTALDAGFLLTLEMVFTALLAAAFLRERMRGRELAGAALLFAAAALVATVGAGRAGQSSWWGLGLVALSALGWGVDNTLSARLVGAYRPHHLIAWKGLVGGSAALLVAFAVGQPFAVTPEDGARVLIIGLLGIGASTVLFYHALQRIGATRTSAIFLPASALAAAAISLALLHEPFTLLHGVGALLLVAGLLLLVPGGARSASTGRASGPE